MAVTMKVFLLFTLFALCSANYNKYTNNTECTCTCTEWSDCKSPEKCPERMSRARSFRLSHHPGRGELDVGKVRMKKMMQEKEKLWSRQTWSRTSVDGRQSEGRVDCVDGMANDLPCRNIHQMSFLDFHDLSDSHSNQANDIWGWTDPETDDEYAIVGLNCGTSFVKMTNAEKPEVLAYLPTATECSHWRDIKTVNDHAYIVAEASRHGLQVFDLSRLRKMSNFSVVEPDATREHFGAAHNIVGNDETDFIYVVGSGRWGDITAFTCDGGLLIYDVSDPTHPEYVTCNGNDGYTHDAQCVIYHGPDKHYSGNEICFLFNEDTLTIVDVTDKDNQIEISREGYDGSKYTHQGWMTGDHTIVLVDDELDERAKGSSPNTKTYIWDITDLGNIVLKNTYVHQIPVIDHNQYINDPFTFQSNYVGGLRVLYIHQDEYDLTEVGYFDVYPQEDSPTFKGTWSNYPYFPSGNVAVTSIDYGLFIVEPDYEAMEAAGFNEHYGEQTRLCNNKRQVRPCVADTCPAKKP